VPKTADQPISYPLHVARWYGQQLKTRRPRLLGVPTAEAAPQQQPHYFFIQNPDGSRTQHFGFPPAEYQQAKGGEDRNHGLLVVEILSFI